MRLPWLAHGEAPGPYITIPQYQFNKTKQHTRSMQISHFVLPFFRVSRLNSIFPRKYRVEPAQLVL